MNIDLQWPLTETQSKRLLEFCLASGVDSFSALFLCGSSKEAAWMGDMIDRLAPFSLGVHQLERTVISSGQSHFMPVESWSFNPQTIPLILDACGGTLSSHQIGTFPEDWTFYRKDELFHGIVSHEGFAFLRLSEKEHSEFKSLGLLCVKRD